MTRKLLLLLAAAIGSVGCAHNEGILRELSVGPTGCFEREMVLRSHQSTDPDGEGEIWTIECRGRLYLCSWSGRDAACAPRERVAR